MGARTNSLDDDGVRALFSNTGHRPLPVPPPAADTDEIKCAAFGYLRGHHERAIGVEFRFRTGNNEWYPYNLLASYRYDPSVGLLLKFTGDMVTLVLIRGSNLDLPVNDGSVDLIEGGLQRHRVVYVTEMSEIELRKAADREPTIDRIEIAEFESHEDIRTWLERAAPVFVRR